MKKSITTKIMAMLLVLTAILSITACGGSKSKSQVIGTWTGKEVTVGGVNVSLEEYSETIGQDPVLSFEFKENGKVSADLFGETGDGTYTEEGDTISVKFDGDSQSMTLKDGKLSFSLAGVTFVLEKK